MASHLASLWKWDFLELGNGLLNMEYANISRLDNMTTRVKKANKESEV